MTVEVLGPALVGDVEDELRSVHPSTLPPSWRDGPPAAGSHSCTRQPAGHGRAGCYASPTAAITSGSCRTGKFTELAMKHLPLAPSCSSLALAVIAASATVTRGRSTTSVKRPPPSSVSAMTPNAASSYPVTTTPWITHTWR